MQKPSLENKKKKVRTETDRTMDFLPGQRVYVPCDVHPGPFDERLVVVSIDAGKIQGFVKPEFIHEEKDVSFVEAIVRDVKKDTIWIQIPGSFFETAMGRVSMSPPWAEEHLNPAPT